MRLLNTTRMPVHTLSYFEALSIDPGLTTAGSIHHDPGEMIFMSTTHSGQREADTTAALCNNRSANQSSSATHDKMIVVGQVK